MQKYVQVTAEVDFYVQIMKTECVVLGKLQASTNNGITQQQGLFTKLQKAWLTTSGNVTGTFCLSPRSNVLALH